MMTTNPGGSAATNGAISKTTLLCNLLIDKEKISPSALRRVQALQAENGSSLGILLVKLGLVSDRDLADLQQQLFGLPLIDEQGFPDIPVIEDRLSIKFLKESYVVPIVKQDDTLVVAVADLTNEFGLKAIELACERPLTIQIATMKQIESMQEHYYGDGQNHIEGIVEETADNVDADPIQHLKDLASEAPIIRLVSLMISRGVELRASDIHIEPFENTLKVRYRIDGVLQETRPPPALSTAAIISRIKIMAKMNIAERRLPQDGRIRLRTQGKLIDLRVSTVPTVYGESLVIRILDKQHVTLAFDTLGFEQAAIDKIQRILALPHGITLVSGPTGSGKTTTLYTALQQLNTPEKKVLTVEDPVEYQLEGINQIQVKPQIGLGFPDALRAIVRQDPDVIMIGEMRDLETASIAVQSSLTGHLVLSTVHTNNAGSSITRLLDMKVEDYLLTSTLNGILSQRLVRTLCPSCKTTHRSPPELIDELNLTAIVDCTKLQLYQAGGCHQCADFGYIGRTVIAEFLTLSEPIRRLILAHADAAQLQQTAIDEGMDTVWVDGIKKAVQGITTIEEVSRVTQAV